MLALETRDDWSTVGADVTVGVDTETWTLSAGIRDAYGAAMDLVAWYNDGARAWSDTMTMTPTDGFATTAVNGTRLQGWLPVFTAPLLDTITGTAAFDALLQGELAVGTSWPKGDWDLQLWERRGAGGDACALGAARAAVTGTGFRQMTLRATLTLGDLEQLQIILAAARNPRRGWVLQQSRGIWRQVELGPVRIQDAALAIWTAEIEAAGVASNILGLEGPA